MSTYMNRVIGQGTSLLSPEDIPTAGEVTDGDGGAARIELCVSVGEFDTAILAYFAEGEYAQAGLDLLAVLALRDACNDALAIMSEHMTD